ncbi:tagatose 1,6-diphosphate aldolase [Mesorhizobium sp. 10J20-29]
MNLSAGKYRGFQRVSDVNGTMKMLAADQRGPILGPIAKARGVAEAPYEDVSRFKELLVRHLAGQSSGVLIDPIYAFPNTLPLVGRDPGLMMTLEHSFVEETPLGRKSLNIPGWTVEKSRRAGADAVKILVWYRADSDDSVREHQLSYVRAVGDACREADVAHLLELLVYQLPDEDIASYGARRGKLVEECVADFRGEEFGVDIYKLEPPSALVDVPDPDGKDAAAVQKLYDAMARDLPRPWVLLSAGANAEDFLRSLVYAYRSGATGYLCGRAIWKTAFDLFPNFDAIERELVRTAKPYLERINGLTDRHALPWQKHSAFKDGIALGGGADFPKHY